VDPDSLNQDPDPAFQVNPDPIQLQGFEDQKLKEKIQLKFVFTFILINNCNLLMSKLREKPTALEKRTSSTSKN
jgi:hypothetical protein